MRITSVLSPHIAAGGSQVDDRHGIGTGLADGVDMGHHIVAQLLLVLGGLLVVDVVQVGLHLRNLRLGNRQAQLHLRPGKGYP